MRASRIVAALFGLTLLTAGTAHGIGVTVETIVRLVQSPDGYDLRVDQEAVDLPRLGLTTLEHVRANNPSIHVENIYTEASIVICAESPRCTTRGSSAFVSPWPAWAAPPADPAFLAHYALCILYFTSVMHMLHL